MWRSFNLRTSISRTANIIISQQTITQQRVVSNTTQSKFKPLQTNSILFNKPLIRLESTDAKVLPKYEKPTPKKQSKFYSFLTVFASGVVAFVTLNYLFDLSSKKKEIKVNHESAFVPGRIVPSKTVKHEVKNPGGVKITLYQYVTCPFCCKVRAYLDYFGYNYDIVEVNSISKKQLDWSTYKKVPVVAVQFPTKDNPDVYEDEFVQLNDSSLIVSALETFRLDTSHSLKEIIKYFQPVVVDSKDGVPIEMNNKYFVMLYNDNVSDRKSLVDRKSEREWRTWVDEKFVHVISPNIYRTFSEAVESFKWFDKAGNWQSQFSNTERNLIIYLGSTVMYLLGKRLKYKYDLKDDVRQSLYEMCDEWTSSMSENQVFKGGNLPNLADLALYGSLGSFEGCDAFSDMMTNSKIKNWYEAMREQVTNSKGQVYLNDPKCFNPNFNKKNDLDYDNDCKEKDKKAVAAKKSKWF